MNAQLVRAGRIFLAVMFIFSGVSKLLSMAFFDAMVAELFLGPEYYTKPSGMMITQILTRTLIAIEIALGVAILVDKWVKKLTTPAIVGVLLLFTIHLFYEGLTSEKGFIEGNCGCFGDVLPMNNLESIIKNIVAIVVGVYVWLKYKEEDKLAAWVNPMVVGLVTLMTLSFGIKSYDVEAIPEDDPLTVVDTDTQTIETSIVEVDTSSQIDTTTNEIPQTKVSKDPEPQVQTTTKTSTEKPRTGIAAELLKLGNLSNGKPMNLDQDEVLVCMFSMTCGHCQDSYKEMCAMKDDPELPEIYLINYGKVSEQQYFFLQAGSEGHPHIRTEDYTGFNRLLQGKGFPRMMVFSKGKVVKEWNIDSYNKQSFMDYFGIKEKEKEGGLNLKKKDDLDDEFGSNPWD